MRIVTWNLNSIRARHDRLLAILARHKPDVLCLQELKVEDAQFPFEAVRDGISQTLGAERAVSVRAGLRDDLRRHAQVNYHVQGGP